MGGRVAQHRIADRQVAPPVHRSGSGRIHRWTLVPPVSLNCFDYLVQPACLSPYLQEGPHSRPKKRVVDQLSHDPIPEV